jgi:hypothetical protein
MIYISDSHGFIVELSKLTNYRLPSTHFCEGLTFLSVRCIQPIQQHGRRLPCTSSSIVRFKWFFLVSGVLTVIVQQIHSLRASGVISCQAFRAFELESRAFCKSVGSVCTVPPAISFLIANLIDLYYLTLHF